jgi:hypothetical protein
VPFRERRLSLACGNGLTCRMPVPPPAAASRRVARAGFLALRPRSSLSPARNDSGERRRALLCRFRLYGSYSNPAIPLPSTQTREGLKGLQEAGTSNKDPGSSHCESGAKQSESSATTRPSVARTRREGDDARVTLAFLRGHSDCFAMLAMTPSAQWRCSLLPLLVLRNRGAPVTRGAPELRQRLPIRGTGRPCPR